MGNNVETPNKLRSTSSSTKEQTINIPFEDLPQLFETNDGYYYHIDDKKLIQQKVPIQCGFRYTAIDYEKCQSPTDDAIVNNVTDDIEDSKNDETEHLTQEHPRYEWIYISTIAFHQISTDTSLPEKYEKIRLYLSKNDPIPPYFLQKSKMANDVFQQISPTSLSHTKELKCRIATKYIGTDKTGNKIVHPSLLIWDKNEEFGKYNDKPAMMFLLAKIPTDIEQKDSSEEILEDRIEIQCIPMSTYHLDKENWDYSWEVQDLKLEHGLLDFAHWTLKYEMDNNYETEKYIKDCKKFMIALCNAFNIVYDEKLWTDDVFYVNKQAKKTFSGSWTGNE